MPKFELHLSVPIKSTQAIQVFEEFERTCLALDIKPLVIHLQKPDSPHVGLDVMTSSHFSGNYEDFKTYSAQLMTTLKEKGFEVVREKHEAPLEEGQVAEDGKYFEAHIALTISPHEMSRIGSFAAANGLHLSRNPFKFLGDSRIVQMLTARSYYNVTARQFNTWVNYLATKVDSAFGDENIWVDIEREFVLFDSNKAHEGTWGN